jgi:hypothetical protein
MGKMDLDEKRPMDFDRTYEYLGPPGHGSNPAGIKPRRIISQRFY